MSSESVLKLSKEVIHCMVDKNGSFRVEPIGMVRHRNLNEYHISILQKFIELLRDEDYINEETRLYLFNEKFTIKDVVNVLSNKYGKEVNEKTVASKINYCKRKLDHDFGYESLVSMLSNREKDLSKELKMISYHMKGDKDEIKGRLLKEIWNNDIKLSIDIEKYEAFKGDLVKYSKAEIDKFSAMYKDEIAYLNYLDSNVMLSKIDRLRKEELLSLIKN